jgi:hypothetical protein
MNSEKLLGGGITLESGEQARKFCGRRRGGFFGGMIRPSILLPGILLPYLLELHAGEAEQKARFEGYKSATKQEPALIRFYTFEEGYGEEVANQVNIDPAQRAVTGGPLGSMTIQRYKKIDGNVVTYEPKFGPPPSWTRGRWPWKAAVRGGWETSSAPWEVSKLCRTGITGKEFAEGGTLSGWIRILETDAEDATCSIVKMGSGHGEGFNLTYSKNQYSKDGVLGIRICGKREEKRSVGLEARPVAPGLWHHFAVSFDAQHCRLYLDGKLAAEQPSAGAIVPVGAENYPLLAPFHEFDVLPCRFGSYMMVAHNPARDGGAATARFDIDELSIYKRALTAEEVAKQEQAGRPDMIAPEQLADYRQLQERQRATDSIAFDIPSDSGGYFRVDAPIPVTIDVPVSLKGCWKAVMELETLMGKPVQTIEENVEAGKRLTKEITLPECGVYNLDIKLFDADGKLVKRLPMKHCLGVVPPAPATLTERNPVAFWADGGARFHYDSPIRRMMYFGPEHFEMYMKGQGFDPSSYFLKGFKDYEKRIPGFRAFVWFQCRIERSAEDRAWNEAFLGEAIRLFKGLNVFGLEVTSEPHLEDAEIQGYVTMLETLRKIVDREKPGLLIFPPGAAPSGVAMINKILAAGGLEYVDGVSFHPYSANPIGDYVWGGSTEALKKVVAGYPQKDLPIWNTECSIASLPRVNDRPMTRNDAMAARFGVAESHGSQFFPYFSPSYPEDEAAALQCQAILMDLSQGYKIYTLCGTPDVSGKPSLGGVAVTALAGQVLNTQKEVTRLPMAAAENMCVLIKNLDGATTAAIFSMKPAAVNFKIEPGKSCKTMDMLGNRGAITANADGLITLVSGMAPFYIFDVPADMREVVPLKLDAAKELPENRVLAGAATVSNPFAKPMAGTLAAKEIRGASIGVAKTAIELAPGASETIAVELKADSLKRRNYMLGVDLKDGAGKLIAAAETMFKSSGVIQMVPKAKQSITLDGKVEDWTGIKSIVCDDVDSVVHGKPNLAEVWVPQWVSKEDLSLDLKTAWDEKGLYFLLQVTDDKLQPLPEGDPGHAFQHDCLEFFFDGRKYGERSTPITIGADQIMVVPSVDDDAKECRLLLTRKNKADVQFDLACVGRRTDTGYVIEGKLVPKPGADFKLLPGSQFNMDFLVDDTDSLDPKWLRKSAMAVHGGFDNFTSPGLWGRYELAPAE